LLNIRNHHPNDRIRTDPGEPDDKDKSDSRRTLQHHLSSSDEDDYVSSGGRFYTRPLIHYDMALFLAPMEMAGAVLGVLIQKILPNWLYLLLAGIILAITSYKTYVKYFMARKAELRTSLLLEGDGVLRTNDSAEYGPLSTTPEDESNATSLAPMMTKLITQPAVVSSEERTDHNMLSEDPSASSSRAVFETVADEQLQQRIAFLEVDSVQYPAQKIVSLGILWVGLLVLTLMKGGKGVESIVGITCESPWYIVLIILQFVWMFGFACVYGLKLHRDQSARVAVRYPYLNEDPQWDWASLQLFGLFTFFAGIVAGLIGVGGGMVLGPLMIETGVNPQVSSATTATMIVLTASSVVFMVLTSGMLHWSYALFYFAVCVGGAVFGKSRIDGYVKRTGRSSVIIFILATIIALATVGCLVIMWIGLEERHWCLDGLNSFCSVSKSDNADCPADRLLTDASNLVAAFAQSIR
jgi:uncharacterized membrane protein YfcA